MRSAGDDTGSITEDMDVGDISTLGLIRGNFVHGASCEYKNSTV